MNVRNAETAKKPSNNEKMIMGVLDAHNILYMREYIFDDCRLIKPLRFDFYLPELNVCIEYQGEHHDKVFYRSGNIDKDEEEFEMIRLRDDIKRAYCAKNGICLIEIYPYTQESIIDLLERKDDILCSNTFNPDMIRFIYDYEMAELEALTEKDVDFIDLLKNIPPLSQNL